MIESIRDRLISLQEKASGSDITQGDLLGLLEMIVDTIEPLGPVDPYVHYPGGWEGWMRDHGRADDV